MPPTIALELSLVCVAQPASIVAHSTSAARDAGRNMLMRDTTLASTLDGYQMQL
jgi:hypothetical protein